MSSARGHWSIPIGVAAGLAFLLAALGCLVLAGLAIWGALSESGPTTLPPWAAIALLGAGSILLVLALRPAWSVTAGRRGVGIRRLARRQFLEREQIREVRLAGTGVRRRVEFETHKGTVGVYPLPADAEGLCGHVNRLLKG